MKKLLNILILGFLVLTVDCLNAKTISLFEEPNINAKIVSPIDPSQGVIPIFSPKNSEWIKVADPQNGNVGWIKISELNQNTGSFATGFSVTQKTINSGKGPQSYQIIQFGFPQNFSKEQIQNMESKFQVQQQQIEKSMQNMLHEMNTQINNIWKDNDFNKSFNHFPVIMPVVIFPEKKSDAPKNKTSDNKPGITKDNSTKKQ